MVKKTTLNGFVQEHININLMNESHGTQASFIAADLTISDRFKESMQVTYTNARKQGEKKKKKRCFSHSTNEASCSEVAPHRYSDVCIKQVLNHCSFQKM